MPKKIIILDKLGESSNVSYRVAFWLSVPSTRWAFYVKPAGMNPNGSAVPFKSEWKDATEPENQDLRDGKVTEIIREFVLPTGATLAQVQAYLQTKHTELQTFIDGYNAWVRYGSYWDGTSWTAGGVS
jgi:hypothetical protein